MSGLPRDYVLGDPAVHGDPTGNTGVYRSGRAELRDRTHHCRRVAGAGRQPWAFLTEQQERSSWKWGGLDGDRTREVVDANDSQVVVDCVGDERLDAVVMIDVLVAVRDHGAAFVPPLLADDVNPRREEGVGVTHDCANVQIVLPVLDSYVEFVALGVEIRDDCLDAPVPVAVDDIAPVAIAQQLGIKARIVWPRLGVWANPNRVFVSHDLILPRVLTLRDDLWARPDP